MMKNLPPTEETWASSLGLEDLLEKGMIPNLAWRMLWTEETGRL